MTELDVGRLLLVVLCLCKLPCVCLNAGQVEAGGGGAVERCRTCRVEVGLVVATYGDGVEQLDDDELTFTPAQGADSLGCTATLQVINEQALVRRVHDRVLSPTGP